MSKVLDIIACGINFLVNFVSTVLILATGILSIALRVVTFLPFMVGGLILKAIGASGETVDLYCDAWVTVVCWPVNKAIEASDAIFGEE